MGDVEKDVNMGLADRKRSRGSTTDEKKSAKSSKYKLKYDQKKYKDQKEKVIEARKAKFGIFKKSKNNRESQQPPRDDASNRMFDTTSNYESRMSNFMGTGAYARESNVES